MKTIFLYIKACFLCIALLLPLPAPACTLWGAAGADARGGTLLSKNRDWVPDHHQVLRLVRPKKGLAYLGLYAVGNEHPGLKAGVNEKGVTVISAASDIPHELRDAQTGKHRVMDRILENYDSVDSLLVDAPAVFSSTWADFIMVSDHKKILVAEIALDGKYALKVIDKGVTVHTNHYLEPELAGKFTDKASKNSTIRYDRITELLAQAPRPLTLEQFASFSRDRHDGPNNSLWRTGDPSGKRAVTMASWIVDTPAQGASRLHVVIANPGEPETTQDIVLDEAFWRRGVNP